MTLHLEVSDKTGLQFFGRICASISHEIKNVLTIINEAGLKTCQFNSWQAVLMQHGYTGNQPLMGNK